MQLQLNYKNLPLAKAGPGAVVLVWAGELGLMGEGDPGREGRTSLSISEDCASLVGAEGGAGVEHVGQLNGASHR